MIDTNDPSADPYNFAITGKVFTPLASITARHFFYNNSSFDGDDATANADDDGAIAPDKQGLLPGETAGFANYTSYSRGLNGLMVDIANLAAPGSIGADDFTFNIGNSSDPSTWSTLGETVNVSLREGAGVSGSDRVTLVLPDGAVTGQWLQVTVLANEDTGLVVPAKRSITYSLLVSPA